MRGSIFKRGKTYSISYYIGKDEHGKWRQKWESGFTSKREAERILRERVTMLETTYNGNLSCGTVASFFTYWLENYCEPNLAPNTIQGYQININKHIIPYIGNIPMLKLAPRHIQDLYTTLLKEGLSPTSVRYVHNNIHKALAYGVKMQFIPKNPSDMLEPPKPDDYEATVLNPDQILVLLQNCAGQEIYWPVLLAVTLGLRRGEALALRWEDVDLENQMIFIRHSALCRSMKNFEISKTKSKTSVRTLLLPNYVAQCLSLRYQLLTVRRETLGEGYNPYNVVCFRETGDPYTANALQHHFRSVIEKAKLPPIRFHDLRHSNATLLLRNGIPAKIVSTMLGHSSIQLTMDTYSHVVPDMQEGATKAVNLLLNRL